MSFSTQDFHPGDRIRFRLPRDALMGGAGRNVTPITVGALVLHPVTSSRGLISVIITDPVVVTADPHYASNATVRIAVGDVIERFSPSPDGTPVILDIQCLEGEIISMRRTDGRTGAIRVNLNRDDGISEPFTVDHRGMRSVPLDGE